MPSKFHQKIPKTYLHIYKVSNAHSKHQTDRKDKTKDFLRKIIARGHRRPYRIETSCALLSLHSHLCRMEENHARSPDLLLYLYMHQIVFYRVRIGPHRRRFQNFTFRWQIPETMVIAVNWGTDDGGAAK